MNGKYVAIDCEFVGVGSDGKGHCLARVSLVNYFGVVLLDAYVKPQEYVRDFRTEITGITPAHLENGNLLTKRVVANSNISSNHLQGSAKEGFRNNKG